jgi:hypothetical protein
MRQGAKSKAQNAKLTVNVPTVANTDDDDTPLRGVDVVQDTVVSHANPKISNGVALEMDDTGSVRILTQRKNCAVNAMQHRLWETAQIAGCAWGNDHRVHTRSCESEFLSKAVVRNCPSRTVCGTTRTDAPSKTRGDELAQRVLKLLPPIEREHDERFTARAYDFPLTAGVLEDSSDTGAHTDDFFGNTVTVLTIV